jgi:chemotaxis protein CheD
MRDTAYEMAEVYLQPGELFFAREPTIIRTILGSCVGATFWTARLGIGALFHAQLPRSPKSASPASGGHYVDSSIREIARQLDQHRVDRSEVQVKVFGGADVLRGSSVQSSRPTVGSLNCDAALEVLNDEGFNVIASSLRGTLGRKLLFYTSSGEVFVRNLTSVGPERAIADDMKVISI